MNPDLAESLKYLRLGGLFANWDAHLKLAADKRLSHASLLAHVVREECRLKRENARKLRLRCAKIPEPLVIETYPFERQPKLNKKKVMAVYDTLGYVRQAQNIVWMGGTGVGKTGLATSFLVHAIDHGCTGRFVRFPDLIGELHRSIADHSEEKVLRYYTHIDCLHLDELGYIDVEPAQAGLFFTLMQRRHKKKTTLITTNLGFADWRTFLKNDHLTSALIDRLTETSHIFNMKDCVTLRAKLAQPPAQPTPKA